MRDAHRVVGFVHLQRRTLVACDRVGDGVCTRSLGVGAARQQEVIGGYGLQNASGLVLADDILQDNHVAGFGDGEVRFGGDDHAEGLEGGSDTDIVLGACGEHFAEILRAPVGRDCPQDVGEVFVAEAVCRGQPLEVRFNGDAAALAGDFGFAFRSREQRCAGKANGGGSAAM